MISTRHRTVLGAGLVAAAVLAGCSSSGGDGGTSPGGGPPPSAGGHAPDAATTKAITKAYEVFFDSRETTAHAIATLQHGAKFRSTIIAEGKSNYGKQRTVASVSKVLLVKRNLAKVTFSVKIGSQPVLPNSAGYAVREDGDWKVATQTFCSLLTLEGTAPPLCKDKSITALPG
ncbi:MAG TPA: hypothetical protein VE442_19105 [Jatrophihabitans sp.]|nr:hypothetical protein [Jatrophihabitans sp.]